MQEWEMEQSPKGTARIAVGFACMLILSVMVQLGFSFLLTQFWPEALTQEWVTWVMLFLQYLVGIPVVLLCVRRVPAVPPRKRKMRGKLLAEYFMVGYALMYIGSLIGQGMNFLVSLFLNRRTFNGIEAIVTESSVWLNFLLISILAPIIEEFLFRKVIMDRLLAYGERAAVLVSALMFGLYHGNLYQFFYAFLVGIILGLLYARSGRLGYSIGFHILFNSLGSLVSVFILEKDLLWLTMLSTVLLLTVAALGVVFLIADRRYFCPRLPEQGGWQQGWKRQLLGNKGMILFYLCCAGLFAFNLAL
ncbi:lysostaphin resistance A-like protein [Hominifimenecus sp. rT4P-3]|uniref:CPBP family intramembrane glutamic endopeptidase n=1 Tax=Hominifimenecus sp. rT4P-3 TaxID=3242979 RepID=UPI003DA403F7